MSNHMLGGIDHGYPYNPVDSGEFHCEDCGCSIDELGLVSVGIYPLTRDVCPQCAKKYEEE